MSFISCWDKKKEKKTRGKKSFWASSGFVILPSFFTFCFEYHLRPIIVLCLWGPEGLNSSHSNGLSWSWSYTHEGSSIGRDGFLKTAWGLQQQPSLSINVERHEWKFIQWTVGGLPLSIQLPDTQSQAQTGGISAGDLTFCRTTICLRTDN